jgi:cell division protein FtsI/penicillin-binding protein 2
MTWIAAAIIRIGAAMGVGLAGLLRSVSGFGFRIFAVLFVGALLAALAWAGLQYGDRLAANRAWIKTATANDTTLSLLDAFELARVAGILKVELGPQRAPRIAVGDCGDRLRATAINDVRDTALKILCDTPQGNQVIAEIDQWNSSFELLALRDDFNRPSGAEVSCDNGEVVRLYMHLGCRDSGRHWTARIALNGKDTGLSAVAATGSAPFKDFAMLAEEHERWMNDWLVAGPLGESAPGLPYQVQFTSTLPASTKRAVVQVIGNLHSIEIEKKAQPIVADGVAGRDTQQIAFDQGSVTVKVLCKYTRKIFRGRNRHSKIVRTAECKPGSGDDTPRAYVITISSNGKTTPSVKLYASPRQARFSAVVQDRNDNDRRRWVLQRSANIAVSCKRPLQDCVAADFTLEWSPPTPTKSVDVDYDVVDRNGTSLIDDDGQISADALSAGLAPVVGLGLGDPGSLVWSLDRSLSLRETDQDEVRLSIDLRSQAIVNEILRRRMTERESGKVGGHTKRAAFVLMDAGDSPAESGQILAAASVPSVESGYNIWDLRALMESDAASSPLLGHAWIAPDGASTPGSTFKAVTGLALIERALANPSDSFVPFLLGAQAGDARRKLDIRQDPANPTRDALLVPIGNGDAACPNVKRCQAIRNAEGEAKIEAAYLTTKESKCTAARAGSLAQIGMCEALISSSNLYFGGVARYLDEQKVLEPGRSARDAKELDKDKPVPDLELASMAQRFMCGSHKLPLLSSAPSAVSRRAYRLWSSPVDVLASHAGVNRRQNVALSGFGQAVSATPLAMTAIYGSIAARRIIRPRLTVSSGTDPSQNACADNVPLLRNGSASAQAQYLDILRSGLSGVVFSPSGTAYPHISHRTAFAGRLFAKTGTAQVEGLDYTAWLVGWIEPAPAAKSLTGAPRRLAFACMVTDSKSSGGATCGPIVDEILAALEGQPTTARAPPKKARMVKRR